MSNPEKTQANLENFRNQPAKVPVRIHEETLVEFRRLNPGVPVQSRTIGGRKYPCAMYALPEAQSKDFLRLQGNEAKAEQRRARCLQPDGSGGFIRCPEQNACRRCQRAGAADFDTWQPTSWDALVEKTGQACEEHDRSGSDDEYPWLAETGREDESLWAQDAKKTMRCLIDYLTEIDPFLGKVFEQMLDKSPDWVHPIAVALGCSDGKAKAAIRRAQALAREEYFRLMG